MLTQLAARAFYRLRSRAPISGPRQRGHLQHWDGRRADLASYRPTRLPGEAPPDTPQSCGIHGKEPRSRRYSVRSVWGFPALPLCRRPRDDVGWLGYRPVGCYRGLDYDDPSPVMCETW